MAGISISFDRDLAMKIGMVAAMVYKELYRKQFYWEGQDKLVDGMFWCDQKAIAEWLLISQDTLTRAIKKLEEEGLIQKNIAYRPGTTIRTTWWKVVKQDFSKTQIASTRKTQNKDFYIKADTEADTQSVSGIVTVIERKKKGENWVDGRRIYTTEEEAEKIEGCSKGDYPDFYYWSSRKFVGDESKKKRKCNMPVGLLKLEYEKVEPTVEVNGKKVKVSYKERLY